MGAWSHLPFGNDTANDWAYELEDASDLSVIEAALTRVLDAGDDYLEAPEAEEAVAAIEVLAHLLGRPTNSDSYTEKVQAWVAQVKLKPNPALLNKARQALQRIVGEDSELAELWAESDEAEDWQASMAQLREALVAA